ncbi:MAG TPA: hypothetical protein VHT04_00760 [Stellaceae bacterium]|nr:hypothetical protein [Stellaceae bacterium]
MTGRIFGGNATNTREAPYRRMALWLAAGLLVAAIAAPATADARGFVSFGFGVPLAGPPAYYYPPPPPVYYYPPPAYYTPPPAYYAPPPAYYAPPAPQSYSEAQEQTCREYQSTTTIDGRQQRSYGTACLQPDGTWQIVR